MINNILPNVEVCKISDMQLSAKTAIIISEGFEDRSLHWINKLNKIVQFEYSIICKYDPEKKSRFDELLPLVKLHSKNEPELLTFYRYEPQRFELEFNDKLKGINVDEIVVDISVMSKLMIMIILCSLKKYNGIVRIIYSEPENYAPSEIEYLSVADKVSAPQKLPSLGVHDVVRTSMLSSSVMQRNPSLVICFTSFNDLLIRALLSVINPTHLFLINGTPPHLKWREKATQNICEGFIHDYSNDNPIDANGFLERKASTLYYSETYDILAATYKRFCYKYRILIAPTGSKMQAVACALFKICCPDVHVEYPTPESFYFQGYSSNKIRNVHEVRFNGYETFVNMLTEATGLNG